jgi:hypothetical protein
MSPPLSPPAASVANSSESSALSACLSISCPLDTPLKPLRPPTRTTRASTCWSGRWASSCRIASGRRIWTVREWGRGNELIMDYDVFVEAQGSICQCGAMYRLHTIQQCYAYVLYIRIYKLSLLWALLTNLLPKPLTELNLIRHTPILHPDPRRQLRAPEPDVKHPCASCPAAHNNMLASAHADSYQPENRLSTHFPYPPYPVCFPKQTVISHASGPFAHHASPWSCPDTTANKPPSSFAWPGAS